MAGRSVRASLLSFAIAAFMCGAVNYNFALGQGSGQSSEEMLTNASVVKLVRARFSEKTVAAIIRTRPAHFDLSPDALVQLKRNGVSERIILAMIARTSSTEAGSDDWNDDGLFDGEDARANRPNGGGGEAETGIFGSGGSSRERTRGRGMNGGASGDTQTSGSATVRIVRPPVEGGEEPKLERTPTLTNESVIEMIDAGFSEGTIIRRIESSPAAFNLSAAKLAELRRRRVSEKVILAMKEAMGGDEQQHSNASASSGN
ncbi:MAG: hypothetical protein H0V88_13270 [Pyrinomonadaceae bacterium]|nr:hypothetical protein [Pyrinomonadaceae bacterium]